MSGEKTADKFLKSKTPIERWDDFIPRSARFITKVMEEYSDQQNAALRAALAEIIPIAERALRHTWIPETEQDLQDAINDQFVNGPNRNYKAAIERAKRLISEEAHQQPQQSQKQPLP